MDLHLKAYQTKFLTEIVISGSKSESNRLLILNELYPNLEIKNLSNSDDTKILQKILSDVTPIADVHHAGTTIRFLTAFFAFKLGLTLTLTGSKRMQQRPIHILVEALRSLGADISYIKNEGYPPIKIKGKNITQNNVAIQGNVSSQYISALMLVAPSLPNGLEIELLGEVTSVPYIQMTIALLKQLGINVFFEKGRIVIKPQKSIADYRLTVESDWSSASYWYSLVALGEIGSKITLTAYKKNSLQGDSCLSKIYEHFGITTTFLKDKIILEKKFNYNNNPLLLDLKNAPDIAQTIAVTCFGLGISCDLLGLHTLKIKETDRLTALKKELEKVGATITITKNSLHLKPSSVIIKNARIATYNDHRMAMAFAPLATKVPITILNAGVVSKSYPNFWKDFEKAGILHFESENKII